MILKKILFLISFLFVIASCSKDDITTDTAPETKPTEVFQEPENEINAFIYRAMNEWYLYKDNQPLLADDYFDSVIDKNNFIDNGGTPEEFFEKLKVDEDRFSQLNKNSSNKSSRSAKVLQNDTGFLYDFAYINETELIGIVLQIVKGSNAEAQGLKRGDLFSKINGATLTLENIEKLMNLSNYNLTKVNIDGFDENGEYLLEEIETLDLYKETLTENPIVIAKTFDIEGHKIGYLFYKYFDDDSEDELNDEFAKFKADGITDLVLDLRYNSGGNEKPFRSLASMITGQFTNQVLFKEEYNQSIQDKIDSGLFNIKTTNYFQNKTLLNEIPINSLGLERLYVITSKRTASSSELLIQTLQAYINVVVIGDKEGTAGKSVSKTEMYDAPDYFSEQGANSSHDYVLDLVRIQAIDKDGNIYSDEGIFPTPTFEATENLSILGDENEKLLSLALSDITGTVTSVSAKNINKPFSFEFRR